MCNCGDPILFHVFQPVKPGPCLNTNCDCTEYEPV